MVGDDHTAERERAGGELARGLLLGQRLLLVLLEELGGGIDVLVRAAHAAKVRSPRSRDHPLRAPVSNRRRDAAWAQLRIAGRAASVPAEWTSDRSSSATHGRRLPLGLRTFY